MKKAGFLLCICLSVLCIGAIADVNIDEDNFPDSKFRSYVSVFDLNSDGQLDENEITNIREIVLNKPVSAFYDPVGLYDINTPSISLKGMEFFPELNSIYCSYLLESLDVSPFPKLKSLNIDCSQLPSLDVSHNPLLTELSCDDCQLTQLDVSNNPYLMKLECSFNQLTSLVLTNNSRLVRLFCNHNKFEELDLSGNPELVELDCGDNQIKDLDLSNNNKLERLYVYRNSHINLPKSCASLQALQCIFCDLTSIDTSGYPQLMELNCSYNHINSLNLSGNSNLQNVDCSDNELTELDISSNDKIEGLMCNNNALQTLNLGKSPALKWLYCTGNQLSTLDLAKRDELEYVDCCGNNIRTLDLQHCKHFEDLVLDWEKETYQVYNVGTVKAWSGQMDYVEYHLVVDIDVELLTSWGSL